MGMLGKLFGRKRGPICSICRKIIPSFGTSVADAITQEGGELMDSKGKRLNPFDDPELSAPLYAGLRCATCGRIYCSKCHDRFKNHLNCPNCQTLTLRQL